MLLILEIMLTASAWRKGYKGLALLPLGFALLAGFLIGMNNPGADVLSVIWIDILAILILVAMNALAKAPENEKAKETKESGELIQKQDGRRELATSQPESEFN